MRKLVIKVRSKIGSTKGVADLVVGILVFASLALFASGGVSLWGQMVKLDDLQQMAQAMAREIALEGRIDGRVESRLEDLQDIMRMDVEMDVDGDFIGGTQKLRLQSDFTVTLSYKTDYGVGWINWGRDKTYAAKAVGTAEQYFK